MMSKIVVLLGLVVHGAVAIRLPGLSEALGSVPWHLLFEGPEPDKVDEKKIDQEKLKPEKLDEEKLKPEKFDDEEKLVDEMQKMVKSKVRVSATRHQVKELIRRMRKEGVNFGMGVNYYQSHVQYYAKRYLPLDVTASAVAFCGDLVKAVMKEGETHETHLPIERGIARGLHRGAEELCSQVLTGNLSNMSSAPQWAVEAAQVAEMDGRQHPFGRLDGVAWKHSLTRVCHDECEELVLRMMSESSELAESVHNDKGTIEDACADHVVRHVEAEILGCCSKSCGWNGQFCSFFPFLSSKEQTAWQAECCSERNILTGSSRQQLCDSTLSQVDKIKSQNLTDQRRNNGEDREILGQDESDASNSVSLMERSFGGSLENRCPQHINLHNIYSELFNKDWKRMPSGQVEMGRRKQGKCEKTQPSRDACKAFLLDDDIKVDQNEKTFRKYQYICWDACGLTPTANPKLESLAQHVKNPDLHLGTTGVLFVHKDIYSTEWNIVPKLTSP